MSLNITKRTSRYQCEKCPCGNKVQNLFSRITRGATVTGCAPVISFCCKGLNKYDKQC